MVRFTLRQLAFLKETARTGGIAAAARQLNVSAAAISSALDKLEDVTNLTLFDRFPARGMRLTRDGEAFLADAEALLLQAEALDKRASEISGETTGSIRIGTHYAIAQKIVLPAVLAFRETHPDVHIEVMEDDFPKLVDLLDSGEVDALFVFDQGFQNTRHLVDPLVSLPPLVTLSANHPLAEKQDVNLSDLVELPYIAVSRAGPGVSYLELLNEAGLFPEVPLTSRSRELVQAYVGKGFGFTLVGFSPTNPTTIEGDTVVTRPLSQNIGHFDVVMARARSVRHSKVIKSFLDLCCAQV